jgi:hypothetical protein
MFHRYFFSFTAVPFRVVAQISPQGTPPGAAPSGLGQERRQQKSRHLRERQRRELEFARNAGHKKAGIGRPFRDCCGDA